MKGDVSFWLTASACGTGMIGAIGMFIFYRVKYSKYCCHCGKCLPADDIRSIGIKSFKCPRCEQGIAIKNPLNQSISFAPLSFFNLNRVLHSLSHWGNLLIFGQRT